MIKPMIKLNQYLPRLIFALLILLGTALIPLRTMQVIASTRSVDDWRVHFRQPNTGESSAPQDRPRGGGARPVCSTSGATPVCSSQGLMALVPSPEMGQAWGQTIVPDPTLWFYVPYAATDIARVEFELWDEDNNLVFRDRQLTIPVTPGVIPYPISSIPLEVGKTYRWYFLLRFDLDNPSLDEYVSGRIQRITPEAELIRQLDTAPALEQAQLLADAGIWYDTLTHLAAVYPQHPETWSQFLQMVGLSMIAEEPLVLTD